MLPQSRNSRAQYTGFATTVSVLSISGYDESLEVLFDALRNEHRRYALYCLDRYQTPMSLAVEIALYENDADSRTALPDDETESIYMMLYHNHLPKLAEANLVTYDSADRTAQLAYDLPELSWDDLV